MDEDGCWRAQSNPRLECGADHRRYSQKVDSGQILEDLRSPNKEMKFYLQVPRDLTAFLFKDFIYICEYTVALFRHIRRGL